MEDFVPLPDVGDLDIRKTFLKIQPVLPSSPVKMGATWERQNLINEENGKQLLSISGLSSKMCFFAMEFFLPSCR
jgi:hypothetical protein